jgi:hypothetical protein
MSTHQSAEENLQMIRSLMERTATYRAVSLLSSAWAGCLSVAAFALNLLLIQRWHSFSSADFFNLWMGVLVLAGIGNTVFLFNDAKKAGTSFPSPALLSALRSMFPSFFVAGALTAIMAYWGLFRTSEIRFDLLEVPVWCLFYGLGLLGTQHFAPRSIVILGWFFVASPFILLGSIPILSQISFPMDKNFYFYFPSALMAATFGLYHLLYAAAVYSMPHQCCSKGEA